MDELVKIYNTLNGIGVSRVILDIIILFGVLIIYSYKWQPIIDKIKYRNKLNKQAKTDDYILNELENSKEQLLCDRLSIYEFHNSNHNLMRKSFMKHSCTYEVCRSNILGYNLSRRDLPNGSSKEIIQLIQDKKDIIINDSEKYEGSNNFKEYLKLGDIKSIIIIPILNNATTCGFITIEFTRSNKFDGQKLDNLIKASYILVGKINDKICLGI